MVARLWLLVRLLWVSPTTMLGLLVGILALLTGGRAKRIGKTIEFSGGLLRPGFEGLSVSAMTLGHVIIGIDESALEYARVHEWIHVHQYERWGPMFLPAYLAASIYCKCRGRHSYLDNPFERQAYANDGRCLFDNNDHAVS